MSESISQYQRQQRQRDLDRTREEIIRVCVEEGNEAVVEGRYDDLAAIICKRLYPNLQISKENYHKYDEVISACSEDYVTWHPDLVAFFINHSDITEWVEWRSPPVAVLDAVDTDDARRKALRGLFDSLVTAGVAEGIIDPGIDRLVDLYEYESKIGERIVSPTSNYPPEQQIIDPDDDLKFSINVGGTGAGKTTFLETLAIDRIRRNNKLFDIHDTEEAENILLDIAQRQQELRQIRKNMGLKPTLTDEEKRDIQILCPLSKSLADSEITYDTDGDTPVTPFVIPACELSRDALQLLVDQTSAQQKYIEDAYEKVKDKDNWTIRDLAEAVVETGARADTQERILKNLSQLQETGYIRDADSEYVVDWHEIMEDNETITSLTTMFVEDDAESLLIVVYVLNKLYEERKQAKRDHDSDKFEDLTLLIRELSELAPASTSEDDRLSAVQNYSVEKLQLIGKRHRHYGIELIADTQQFDDQLDDEVRGHAHRLYVFRNQLNHVKKAFKAYTEAGGISSDVSNYDTGKCALVGHTNTNQHYITPIKAAPPPVEHFDTDKYGDGFEARARLTNETLKTAQVDASVPDELTFAWDEIEEDEESDSDDTVEIEDAVDEFVVECTRHTGDEDDRLFLEDLLSTFQTWSMTVKGGSELGYTRADIGSALRKIHDLGDDEKSRPTHPESGKRATAYTEVVLNEKGESYED